MYKYLPHILLVALSAVVSNYISYMNISDIGMLILFFLILFFVNFILLAALTFMLRFLPNSKVYKPVELESDLPLASTGVVLAVILPKLSQQFANYDSLIKFIFITLFCVAIASAVFVVESKLVKYTA
jgi:hypothetical protein